MADYATLLRDHVTLACRSIDRIFVQAWVPKLQSVGMVCTFVRWQKGFKIPSSAAFGEIGDRFVRDIERFAKEQSVPLIHFKKGESKEEFVRPALGGSCVGVKRQLDKAGIGYQALDNGFRSCEDPKALQRICDRLGPGALKSYFWRWQRRLPTPFTTADLRAGYVYDIAFRQLEVSDTRVFDRPQAGRSFFEGVIRDHLDLGCPDQVALIFERRITRSTTAGSAPR